MLSERKLRRMHKAAQQALKDLHSTDNGKALFEILKITYVLPTCFGANELSLVKRTAEKELVEYLFSLATGREIIESQETFE